MPKQGGLWRVIRQTGLYAIGNFAVKASGLLLAPLYLNTEFLSAESYGHLVLLEATAQIIIPVMGLGLATGMLKFMAEPEDRDSKADIPFTTLVLSGSLAVAAFALIWLAAPALASFLVDDPAQTQIPRIMGAYAALKVVSTVPFMLLRVREKAGWYAASVTAEWLVLLAGVYVFLAVERMGLEGVMIAYAASAGVSALVMTGFMLTQVSWRMNVRLIGGLLRFGVPLVLTAFAGLFLNVGDRYILKWLTDAETVGVYGWASRLGGAINMLFVQSFQLAFMVVGLKTVGEGDRSLHRRTFRHYTIWTGWAVLGLSLLSYDLTLLLSTVFAVDPLYLRADPMVLPIALGFMGYGIYIVVNNVLYASALTHIISLNVLMAAVANALLNFLLIPWIGAYGAAVSTTLAYALLAAASARIAERRVHVGYPWRILGLVILMIVGLWTVAYPTYSWATVPRLLVRFALIAAYLPLVWWSGLYKRVDLEKGLDLLRRWRGRE